MRKLLTILFLFSFQSSFCTNYYVANAGSDSNNGTTVSTPFQTIAKVNSLTLNPGDAVYFNQGDTFYGTITISNSGTSGNPITYGSYGTGAQPIITGLTSITSWTDTTGNIWESTSSASTLSTINMLLVNKTSVPMGRWPNITTGYLPYQSFSGNTSITSSSLTGTPNWTGAQVVLRKLNWVLDVGVITSQSGGTLNYTGTSAYNGFTGQGFFIQNDLRTLDSTNEWYYNPGTQKLYFYSASSPANIQIPTTQTLCSFTGTGYYTLNNISFIGSNSNMLNIDNSASVTITNCIFKYAGLNGIYSTSSGNLSVSGSNISVINNDGIYNYNLASVTAMNDTLENIGMIPGAGANGDNAYVGIDAQSDNANIRYCRVDSVGYDGIAFNHGVIKYNYVSNVTQLKQDGGGIYIALATRGDTVQSNIVTNVGYNISAKDGYGYISGDEGVYFDTKSNGIVIDSNTIIHTWGNGIFLADADSATVINNTCYDAGFQPSQNPGFAFTWYLDTSTNVSTTPYPSGFNVTHNIFWGTGTSATGYSANVYYLQIFRPGDSTSFGKIDSNYLINPVQQSYIFRVDASDYATGGGGYTVEYYSLAGWQALLGYDIHSSGTPMTLTDTSKIQYFINPSINSKTFPLSYKYMDAKGTTYNSGSITLQPYTSAVLIQNGSFQPPVQNYLILYGNIKVL